MDHDLVFKNIQFLSIFLHDQFTNKGSSYWEWQLNYEKKLRNVLFITLLLKVYCGDYEFIDMMMK